ncbi:MAG: aminotransferase class I/II-fold pyridoxal phosphate-dependent enzyme [Hyphomicrobiales bacterium]|nr:aminotransferase class I/II-fold pyridoxal phosphate-dependent enzyme [Hyphomicrobiales bacterium]
MSRKLAERVASLKPSATVEMTERVRAARLSGRKIIPLSSGDPNIETDPRIIVAAERAMRAGDTHYGPAQGLPALREAIVRREALRSGVNYDPADVIVTPGGKFALLTALMGIVEAGDEVLVPEPGWVSYGPCVRLCGGTPLALSMLDHIDEELLESRVSARTKALVLNSPVNPTGRVFSAQEIAHIVGFAERHDLWIVFDQVYSDLLHEGIFPAAQAAPGAQERVLVVDSLSKTFGMTGWRLGYLALPKGTAKTILKFIQHSIYCVPGFIQSAAIEALSLYDELVPGYRRMFRHRLDHATERLSAVDGIACRRPQASFYLFPSVAADDVEVARHWLENIDVATLPGSSFGSAGAGHIRMSLTCSETDLDEALDRISRVGLAA